MFCIFSQTNAVIFIELFIDIELRYRQGSNEKYSNEKDKK